MTERRRPVFVRFSALTRDSVNRDFQVHTSWTDGQATVAEVLRRAEEVALSEIAFTEHARAGSTYYPDFFREVDEARSRRPEISVYRGFEVKVTGPDGSLDISDEMRAAAEIVLGSVHSFPLPGGGAAPARSFDRKEAEAIELRLAESILLGRTADVLSHAGGMCLRTFGSFPMESLERLVALAAERGVAFEINSSYHDGILADLLDLLARYDPFVSIGSDAHRLDEIGRCRDRLRAELGL